MPFALRRASWIGTTAPIVLAVACAQPPPAADRPYAIPVDVMADTGRSAPLRVGAPERPPARASVWLARVSPTRPASLPVPSFEMTPETLATSFAPPPALEVDEGLKPPLPRSRAPLRVPAGARGFVELDVQVDERGRVADARRAGGRDDPLLVRAAVECARGMHFYPALRAGKPVAVWCRQRFDFGVD
jgi:TonB family protein